MPLTDKLTDPQREAVTHVDGPLLVLAGPGSGKTTVVTSRVVHLVEQGIPPWQILGLTFTNKAAGEMRERVEGQLPPDLPGRRGLTITTFHAFCARLLRRYADAAGVSDRFTIYDSADQRAAMKLALASTDLNERNFTPAAVIGAVSAAKNRLLNAAAFARESTDFYSRAIARAYTAYERTLRENDALDFDDLLLVTARLLRDDAGVRRELQERYQYLLVDEYQDTNHAQFVIAGAIAAEHRNICVVGDPDQSIYGWRGADITNILEFEQQYPETRVIPLGENFRSTAHIVAAADHLIRHNVRRKHKPLFTALGDGEKVTVMICRDEHHEASCVVEEFRRRHEEDGVAWKDMAVLYRMTALSRVLEETFRDAQIPHVIARGTAFYERKEIKDALSYLRLITNPSDEVSLRRIINVPARGIGKSTLSKIELFGLNRQLRLFEAMRCVGDVAGLTARAVTAVGRFVATVEAWRAAAGVVSGAPGPAEDGPAGAPAESAAAETPAELIALVPPGPAPTSPVDTLADLVARVVRESGMEKQYRRSTAEEDAERLENLEELINAAAQFEPVIDMTTTGEEFSAPDGEPVPMTIAARLAAYLESVALVSDADAIDPANGAVTLMTLHAAKGLEFDAVAMVGLEAGLLPHHRAADSDEQLEEERRLCFVGVTRARRGLLMTRAVTRTHRGIRERSIESQFLRELPGDAIVHCDEADETMGMPDEDGWPSSSSGRRRRSGVLPSLMSEFPVGSLVRHPTFGVGRVEAVTPRPVGSSARVTFTTVGTKTLILERARLERVG